MNNDLNRFIQVFRDLEHKEFMPSVEEEKQLEALKQKLIYTQQTSLSNSFIQRTIAIASLYPQTGSSFIASNLAYYHACSQIQTTLCELPSISPYFYFALDFAKRGHSTKSGMIIPLQQGLLRVKPTPPLLPLHKQLSQAELTNWFVQNHKGCSFFIIDISNAWQSEQAIQIGEWVDEVWFVLDDNIPRLASVIMSEEVPNIWALYGDKVKLIVNKWNDKLKRAGAIKQVEGTLSLWHQEGKRPGIDIVMPLVDRMQISHCYLEGRIFLEKYPDSLGVFEPLVNTIGIGGGL
ncbi:hypothetical protein ACQCN2_21145 [Brevibacillus ginsengisoli]|uniref:hypothetical protein n=1 Tax=Brevibacillus ginsengisoli TaxID=363854 RepID=UPI003CEB6882